MYDHNKITCAGAIGCNQRCQSNSKSFKTRFDLVYFGMVHCVAQTKVMVCQTTKTGLPKKPSHSKPNRLNHGYCSYWQQHTFPVLWWITVCITHNVSAVFEYFGRISLPRSTRDMPHQYYWTRLGILLSCRPAPYPHLLCLLLPTDLFCC